MGLPFPKELAPLGPGRVLMDSCLDLLRAAQENSGIHILLLEDGEREQTAEYIREKLPGVPLAMVRQSPLAFDLPDAVLRLAPWFSVVNILLLPDAIYDFTGDPVTEIARKALSYGFCFGAVKTPDAGSLGALRTHQDRVLFYQDKPHDPGSYDAAWGILGFSKGTLGIEGLRKVQQSTSLKICIADPPVRQAPVIWLQGFRDCGTWDSYLREVRGELSFFRDTGRYLPGEAFPVE